jgi:acetylornithine/succinyldiaminopimelate/putrescine aminotransferase
MRPGTEARVVMAGARERGALLSVASERVLRLSPPLVITPALLEEGVRAIDQAAAALGALAPEVTIPEGRMRA